MDKVAKYELDESTEACVRKMNVKKEGDFFYPAIHRCVNANASHPIHTAVQITLDALMESVRILNTVLPLEPASISAIFE